MTASSPVPSPWQTESLPELAYPLDPPPNDIQHEICASRQPYCPELSFDDSSCFLAPATHVDHLGRRGRAPPVSSDQSMMSGTAKAGCAPLKALSVGMAAAMERVGLVTMSTSATRPGRTMVIIQDPEEGRSSPAKVPSNWRLSISTRCPLSKAWLPLPSSLLCRGNRDIGHATLLPQQRNQPDGNRPTRKRIENMVGGVRQEDTRQMYSRERGHERVE